MTRMCYQHIAGGIYFCVGIAKEIKEKDGEQVILSSLENTALFITPVSTFFDKHPQTGKKRFELVTPIIKVLTNEKN